MEENVTTTVDPKKMKPCPHCKEMILKGAKICPHCHGKIKSWFRRFVVPFIIIIFLFGTVNSIISKKQQMDLGKQLEEIKSTANSMTKFSGSGEELMRMAQKLKKLSTVTEKQKKGASPKLREDLEQLEIINAEADLLIQSIQKGRFDMAMMQAASIAKDIEIKK